MTSSPKANLLISYSSPNKNQSINANTPPFLSSSFSYRIAILLTGTAESYSACAACAAPPLSIIHMSKVSTAD